MTPLLSDARLARQATEGDQRAFAAIYRRYHQDLYRFCLSIVGRPEDAQEALQNTMVKALRSLPGEAREIQLRPWLYRVAHNESVDLLRRRREGPELDDSRASGAVELVETVALRERLERLLGDLDVLPERQRSALVMRELAGLGYEQIGEAFDTSTSVARQTVYEARLSLRELEAGREMDCNQVMRQLSEADGRITRRRDIKAHLRACSDCRAFRDSIDSRRQDLAALSPLPAAVAASILQGLAGGQAATGLAGAGATASGVGVGAGKVAAGSVALKAAATVAVVATVGVTAADRSNLIDAGLPGHSGGNAKEAEQQISGSKADVMVPSGASENGSSTKGAEMGLADRRESKRAGAGGPSSSKANDTAAGSTPPPEKPSAKGHESSPGPPASRPEAARHGQETAAAHKAKGSSGKGQGKTPSKTAKPGSNGSSGKRHGSPAHAGPPDHAQDGGADKGKGQSGAASDQPSANTPSEPEAKAGGGEATADAGGKSLTSP